MSRQLHITVLVDPATIPPEDPQFKNASDKPITEYHVCEALRSLGHRVSVLGAECDIAAVVKTLVGHDPDLVLLLGKPVAELLHPEKVFEHLGRHGHGLFGAAHDQRHRLARKSTP